MTRDTRDKIVDLESLARTLTRHRSEGKKIAHCHGVFDLLHIGHLRHFSEARKLGDVLVVTVTPDRFVNKGPHRPAFTQELRAEMVAALDCVDYVAINRWPTAVEVIELIRPDFYLKGPDYSDAKKDYSGGINLEERAVHNVGGRLVITSDVTFSSSNLLNQYFSVFPPEVRDYLRDLKLRRSSAEVISYLEGLRELRVLVVGDAIIDEYQYCEAIGKSSKEPTLVVRHLSTEKFAGGSLAIANHAANFVDEVGLVAFIGARPADEEFVHKKLCSNIKPRLLYRDRSPTVLKRRFVESYFSTKLFEVYELEDRALNQSENRQLCDTLLEEMRKYDVVIVSDFGHGMMSRESIELICNEAGFAAVNVQSNAGNLGYHTITKYKRANYVCLTEAEVKLEARDRQVDLKQTMLDVAQRMTPQTICVTRGKTGCICYSEESGFTEAPALAGQVVDRIGAGDAFFAITALCVARQVPNEVTALVGNAVGAQAVAIVGNRTPVQRLVLYKHIESILK